MVCAWVKRDFAVGGEGVVPLLKREMKSDAMGFNVNSRRGYGLLSVKRVLCNDFIV